MANTTACACCGEETSTCYCPLEGIIDTLSKKYAMQIVNVIGVHGTLRFGELEDHISTASTTTISDRLEELTATGLATRTQYDEVPPRVEYELTDQGEELRERLEPLLEWAATRS